MTFLDLEVALQEMKKTFGTEILYGKLYYDNVLGDLVVEKDEVDLISLGLICVLDYNA